MDIAAPPAPNAGGTPYQNFEQLAARSGLRPASEAYFNERTQSYCSLLNDGNFTEMMSQVSFPPGMDPTETAQNRSRLEVAILMTGVPAACPDQTGKMQQFVASIMR
jgi:hypothetical protein